MENENCILTLSFPENSLAEAAVISNALESQITRDHPEVYVDKNQSDPNNMDMGTTVVMALGAPAVVTLATGIAAILRRFKAKVTIKADGELIAENVSGEDLAKIVEKRFKPN